MGSGFSHLVSCLKPPEHESTVPEQLDEALGHSFCYVRSSARFHSPAPSGRFLSPSQSLRFDDPEGERARISIPETGFKAISGASVSANTWTPRTVLQEDDDDATDPACVGSRSGIVNGFESSSSFSALPLQPVRRGDEASGLGFFLSGPIERGAMSGPLDSSACSNDGGVPFSAPLGGIYSSSSSKKKKKSMSGIRNAFSRSSSERKRPWVVPVRYFTWRKDVPAVDLAAAKSDSRVQWALGKAGEDRVHVVVSEEHGWLFVGIYDGFNGPDAPEFLMSNLYRSVFRELQGLFWDVEEQETSDSTQPKKVQFHTEQVGSRRKCLWEYLAEDDPEFGLDLSGSHRFAFSVDDALSMSKLRNVDYAGSRRWVSFSKLKQGLSKRRTSHDRTKKEKAKAGSKREAAEEEEEEGIRRTRRKKFGPVDPDLVLAALSRALERTEVAYLDMTDKFLDRNPELALMGSCLLVVLMRDDDVYVMNLGDSRALVAQYETDEESNLLSSSVSSIGEGIIIEEKNGEENLHSRSSKLIALQLSTDHSTSIEEEVNRIKDEHPCDDQCIVNDRVKGRLKVTRAFGAGFLKRAKWNEALLEMFRNEFVGTAPYISCLPSLRHHRLCGRDQFLILSSDGLYQYLSNQEVVTAVSSFMEKFPDGDPAQHLIEELLLRAADKAGIGFHELLDIPQGDRRKYHDDVTVMVISLEGRIWKSSGKYP